MRALEKVLPPRQGRERDRETLSTLREGAAGEATTRLEQREAQGAEGKAADGDAGETRQRHER